MKALILIALMSNFLLMPSENSLIDLSKKPNILLENGLLPLPDIKPKVISPLPLPDGKEKIPDFMNSEKVNGQKSKSR